jgi:HD-GYP domain-containing protein (c-di-GMP phosphodiesterase class II)
MQECSRGRVSLLEHVEIVWIYRPNGAPVGKRVDHGTTICFREGSLKDAQTALEGAGSGVEPTCLLFAITASDYAHLKPDIVAHWNASASVSRIGFVVFEGATPLTLRARKRLKIFEAEPWLHAFVPSPVTYKALMSQIQRAAQNLFLEASQSRLSRQLSLRDGEARAINEISAAMTSQSSVDSTLRLVLEKAMELSASDSGFLLLRENLGTNPREGVSEPRLLRSSGSRFFQKLRLCRSQNVKLNSDTLDPSLNAAISHAVNNSSGVVWQSGWDCAKPGGLNSNASHQSSLPQLQFEFDSRNYDIASYCLFPIPAPSGDILGLILLVNKTAGRGVYLDSLADIEKHVEPFQEHDLDLLEALAGQVGVSLDHSRLIQNLKRVFESFVEASVVAIESRDPSTKGHSERVAVLTVGLAQAVNSVSDGLYGSVSFNESQLYELKYAALLHDFGKIGVRENILRKERKLYHHELMTIQERFHNLEKQLNLKYLEDYLEKLMKRGQVPSREDIDRIQRDVQNTSKKLKRYWERIIEANEPSIVTSEDSRLIREIADFSPAGHGKKATLLLPEEVEKLTIKRGSLSNEERLEIESHVEHSFKFLISIPWTQELANVPEIVHAHHERLDGTGYPRKLVADEIPIQAKIMAIADVYDALVAVDRPYKLALPHERALSIIEDEVRDMKLDSDLFRIFVEARIGELIRQSIQGDETAA